MTRAESDAGKMLARLRAVICSERRRLVVCALGEGGQANGALGHAAAIRMRITWLTHLGSLWVACRSP